MAESSAHPARVSMSLVGIPLSNCNYRAKMQTAQTFNKIPASPRSPNYCQLSSRLGRIEIPMVRKERNKIKEEKYTKKKKKMENCIALANPSEQNAYFIVEDVEIFSKL
jgi:hypothetical protein